MTDVSAVSLSADWTPVVALIGSSAFLAIVGIMAYRSGKAAIQKDIDKKVAEDAKNQAGIAVNPRNSDDSLSDGTF